MAALPPQFTVKPQLRQEAGGIIFYCQLQASPKPDVQWFRGPDKLSPTDRLKMSVDNAGVNKFDVNLKISNVAASDGGSYQVVAKNRSGEVRANVNLNIGGGEKKPEGVAPTFVQKPAIKQETGRLVFECQIQADPEPNISWFKENSLLNEDNRLKFRVDSLGNQVYVVALELYNVTAQDGGSYKVTAKNQFGTSNATLKLNVDAAQLAAPKGQQPTFKSKPEIRQVGSNVVFEVTVAAEPAPNVVWYFGNAVLQKSARFLISQQSTQQSEYIISLEIVDVTKNDAGQYKVIVKNDFGESTANLALNLDGKLSRRRRLPQP
ncbi:disorganized muscle protein 1-like [Tubulanus polymorphus]|uniref:disorganized muscle protein 1-like n=1 Tax=Tubulanus polymorphus TaxID=672921 RepID=UPI003DA61D75